MSTCRQILHDTFRRSGFMTVVVKKRPLLSLVSLIVSSAAALMLRA
jgi:hypothetical protein